MTETDVEVALAAALAGVAVVREMYGTELPQQAKSPTDFATEADVAAEEAIRAVVLRARPLDTFEGEEFGVSAGADDPTRPDMPSPDATHSTGADAWSRAVGVPVGGVVPGADADPGACAAVGGEGLRGAGAAVSGEGLPGAGAAVGGEGPRGVGGSVGGEVASAGGGGGAGSGGRRWLVDPICGTLNFAAATPLAAVNVALRTEESVLAAVSADPIAGEFFWTDGQEAWCRRSGSPDGLSGGAGGNDRRLVPSARSLIVDVGFGDVEASLGVRLIGDRGFRGRFSPRVLSTTLALAWVAAGRHAAYVTDGWLDGSVHYTAGIALCQAAGCVVTDLAGNPVHTGRGLIAAADRETHERLVGLIAPHLAEVGVV